jgi:hypothetical protein
MTEKNSTTETLEASASAADLQEATRTSRAGADSVGVASLALNASAADPAVARELSGFLHEQRELASRQRVVADKQSALLDHRLERVGLEKAQIEAQNDHLHLQHIHGKLRLVLDAGLAVFGVASALLLVWAVWTAIRSNSVVVEAFTVPPSFEARGLAGAVVAGEFLDRLQEIQRRGAVDPTISTPIEDAWSREVRVEVPQTGISLGDIQKYLRSWLGHDVRVSSAVKDTDRQYFETLNAGGLTSRSGLS